MEVIIREFCEDCFKYGSEITEDKWEVNTTIEHEEFHKLTDIYENK